jgi:hypothetical protein
VSTPKDTRDEAARAAVERVAYGQPRQLTTRLLELTPELAAHYGPLPTPTEPEVED